jgi:hypothetical protein
MVPSSDALFIVLIFQRRPRKTDRRTGDVCLRMFLSRSTEANELCRSIQPSGTSLLVMLDASRPPLSTTPMILPKDSVNLTYHGALLPSDMYVEV